MTLQSLRFRDCFCYFIEPNPHPKYRSAPVPKLWLIGPFAQGRKRHAHFHCSINAIKILAHVQMVIAILRILEYADTPLREARRWSLLLESLFHYVHALLILCISLGARASTDVSAPYIGNSRVGGGEGMIVIFFTNCV